MGCVIKMFAWWGQDLSADFEITQRPDASVQSEKVLIHASAPSIYSQGVSRETWGQLTFGKSINKDWGGSMPERPRSLPHHLKADA